MHRMFLLGSLVLALNVPANAGQVYKWVDAHGVTHFSAQPPPGQEAITLKMPASPSFLDAPQEPQTAPTFEDIANPEQAALNEQARREAAQKEAERKAYCTQVRTSLAQLQTTARIRMEIDGELRYLKDEEKQAQIAEAQKQIAEHCD